MKRYLEAGWSRANQNITSPERKNSVRFDNARVKTARRQWLQDLKYISQAASDKSFNKQHSKYKKIVFCEENE